MKRPYSVGYFSSYDRGLECLLDMWPKIKEQVPEATLDIYYGWDTFKSFYAKNPEKMKWLWQMMKKMRQDGVVEHGRVDHQQLADAMKEIKVWAYPTEFTEIHCITALKAQEAGMIPVTTYHAALRETVYTGWQTGGNVDGSEDIYTNKEKQQLFIEMLGAALRGNTPINDKRKPPKTIYWTDVAKQWDKALA